MATATPIDPDETYSFIENLYTAEERTDPPDKSNIKETLQIFKEPPDPSMANVNKDLLKNIREHVRNLLNRITTAVPEKIMNQQEAEEARNEIQETDKIMKLIASIPNDLKEKEITEEFKIILRNDISLLNEVTQNFLNLYKQRILKYNQAFQKVIKLNNQHETRNTTKIIKGAKDIPEHFFANTPILKQKRINNQILPWEITDSRKEDEQLETVLIDNHKKTNIINYTIEHKLICPKKDIDLEEVVEDLNQRLNSHNINLNVNDEDLEGKIKFLHKENFFSNEKQNDTKSQTVKNESYNISQNNDPNETLFFTPGRPNRQSEEYVLMNNNPVNQSSYFTPQGESISEIKKNKFVRDSPTNIPLQWEMNSNAIPQYQPRESKDITTLSDLHRFQREANFPSVRSKLENNSKLKTQVRFNEMKDDSIYTKAESIEKLTRKTNEDQPKSYDNSIPNSATDYITNIKSLPNKLESNKNMKNRIRKLEVEMDNLEESTDSASRIIKRIENVDNFTFQELQDLYPKLTEYNKVAKNHRKAQMDFKKEFIDIEDAVLDYDPNLFEEMNNTSDLASARAKELAKALKSAEDRILDEKVSNSNVSTQDSKEIIYSDFNAGNLITDKNIYEVIKNHESNHKLNRTSNYLKGIILKKHLKGNAKLSISDDITNYDEIKKALIKRYGNVNELLATLYNHHNKIGQTPPRTGSTVQWAKINETCKAHLTLIRRADLLLKNANDNVINEKYVTDLIKFLCQEDRYEVLSIKEDPAEAYKALKRKFTTTLDMSQEMLRLNPKNNTNTKKRVEEQAAGTSEFGLVTNYELTVAKECKICQRLQEIGNMQDFFENHLQNKNTGSFYNAQCPLYLKMTMKERLDFLKQNQICVYCVNPLNSNHKVEICHQKNLNTRNGRRPPYTCRTPGCPNRLELCMVHKETNMNALLKRKENLQKSNIEMCLVSLTDDDQLSEVSTPDPYERQHSIEKVKNWLTQTENLSCYDNTSLCNNENIHQESMNTHSITQDNDRPLLVKDKEILLNQQDVLSLNGHSKPLFMFMKLKGYTRGINLMFDSGSSAVVCTDSIPGKELKACKIQNQDIELQGLGATRKQAQAWTLLLPVLHNKHVATTAYSVPHILGPLSPVNLSPAHNLIKDTAKYNEEVQRSKIYNYLSGNIEILAGIRLNCLFPEKIFQMTNGLALYKLKLASHDHQKMYCLGGPFEVISEMKEIFHESANFLNEIDIGLNQWRAGNTANIKQISYDNSDDELTTENVSLTTSEVSRRINQTSNIHNPQAYLTNELTDKDIEEIDNFLDDVTHSNVHKEVINVIPPNTCINDDYQDDKPIHNNDANAHIIIDINNPKLRSDIKQTQQQIQLHNNVKHKIIPIEPLSLEIARIKIIKWKSSIQELRKISFPIQSMARKIIFDKEPKRQGNKIVLVPSTKTMTLLMSILNKLKASFKDLNICIYPNEEFYVPILKIKSEEKTINMQSLKRISPIQIVKELKIFSYNSNKPTMSKKLLSKIKIKVTNSIKDEFVNLATDTQQMQNNGTKLKTDDARHKDGILVKNLELIIDGPKVGYRCNTCLNCNKCKQNPNQTMMTMKEQLEQYLIEKSVAIDRTNKQFIAKLPLTHDPDETLMPNKNETRIRLKKVLQKLKKAEDDKIKIKAAFDKLKELKYIVKLSELPDEVQKSIESKKTKFYIPWDYVSKATSITTEKRQVYDASAKTPSGNSLNDILSKGCPKMEFDNVLLNFISDKYALCGDIMKFYQSVKLHEDHYHLQLILWNDTMEPDDNPNEYVITRLTFGLKSSSQQLEHCVDLLAEENKHKKNLYRILKEQRYVDDIMGSYYTQKEVTELKKDLNETLEKYGMKIKGFASSYEKPPTNISDGTSLVTGGYIWHPELDILFIRVQPLHYAEKKRGKIMTENIFMEGTLQELDQFVPQDLTLRQVLSRGAQIFDPLGLISPWKTGVKILTRESLESVKKDWDAPLSQELRERWIKKFWDMQTLKQVGFKRCNLPLESSVKSISLICFYDACKHAKVQIIYILHEIEKNIHNVQLLYSKSQLVQTNKTLANMELDSMNTGAEMLNKCCNALPKVDKICLVGDSQITSYWIAKDTISLATFQRNRVSNIRRLIDINNIYRCKGTENIADIGTKGEVNISESIPGSKFHNGPTWLTQGLVQAIKLGHLIPIKETHIDPTDTILWKMATDGLVGKCKWPDELLMKKCEENKLPILAINNQWVSQIKERYLFSEYLLDPLKKNWTKVIRILGIVFYFIHQLITRRICKTTITNDVGNINRWKLLYKNIFDITKDSDRINFCQTFTSMVTKESQEMEASIHNNHIQICEQIKRSPKSLLKSICTLISHLPNETEPNSMHILDLFSNGITANFFMSTAILYYLKKASKELEMFYKRGMIRKHCQKSGQLYFSKNRWMETNQLRIIDDENINLQDLNIQELAPVLDRHSPVAISLALHFHNNVTKHAGADRSHLAIQGSVFIFQGQRLFEDICRDCITCRIKLKQRYTQIMGPLGKEQLSYSAVGRFIFLDMSGPYETRASINARNTRKTSGKTKTWLLHGVCVVSSYSVVQILETYATDSFVQAIHRIASYIGFPQLAFIDSSQTEIKGLTKTKFSMYDASNRLFDEFGITIKLCGVGGESHSRHGVIERRIGLFKKYFEISKQKITELTPIGLYTLALQAASHLNSAPLCTKKRNGSTISSRLITPNCFFLGKRTSHRAPAGIPYIEEDRSTMMDKLHKAADGMLTFFQVNIPDLLLRTCNTKETKEKIAKGDLVLFMKDESQMTYNWKMGIVYELELDEDKEPRIIQITYVNKDEITLPMNKGEQNLTSITKRITRKGIHTIVKLYSIDDKGINNDLAHLNNVLQNSTKHLELPKEANMLVL